MIPLLPGAAIALRHLSHYCELQILTSRCDSITDISMMYVEERLPGIFSGHHFTCGYGAQFPHRKLNKLVVCQKIGAQALLDDAPHHALSVSAAGIPVYMLKCPWNRNVAGDLITPVSSWSALVNKLAAQLHFPRLETAVA